MLKNFPRVLLALAIVALLTIAQISGGANRPRPGETSAAAVNVLIAKDIAMSSPTTWARTYGLFFGLPNLARGEEDQPRALLPLANGDFVVAGQTSLRTPTDEWHSAGVQVRFNPSGQVLNRTAFPVRVGASIRHCTISSAAGTQDGGVVMAGALIDTDFENLSWTNMVARIGPDGSLQWVRTFWTGPDGPLSNGGLNPLDAVVGTRDGGCIAVGYATSSTYQGGLGVLKLDAYGDLLWAKLVQSDITGPIECIKETSDGGVVLCGTYGYTTGEQNCGCDYSLTEDAFLIKLSKDGTPQWGKRYALDPLRCCGDVGAHSAAITPDGGYILAGEAGLPNRDSKTWVCKVGPLGNISWQKTYSGNAGRAIIRTKDGGYLVAGGQNALP